VWVPGHTQAPARRSPEPAGAELLQARDVVHRFRGGSPVSLTLHEREAVAVTGPNGTGKTTLAMLTAGLLAPESGSVRAAQALGGPAAPLHRWRATTLAAAVGTVFQEPEHQFLTRTVADELDLGPIRQGATAATARQRTTELLERLHLDRLGAANPFTLSGGEKRRLSVATALATRPRVLVLDEPTFGQDARTWRELLTLLAELRDDGRAVLAVTHDLPFAAALADRPLALARTGGE